MKQVYDGMRMDDVATFECVRLKAADHCQHLAIRSAFDGLTVAYARKLEFEPGLLAHRFDGTRAVNVERAEYRRVFEGGDRIATEDDAKLRYVQPDTTRGMAWQCDDCPSATGLVAVDDFTIHAHWLWLRTRQRKNITEQHLC
jgi:hypothetical protein